MPLFLLARKSAFIFIRQMQFVTCSSANILKSAYIKGKVSSTSLCQISSSNTVIRPVEAQQTLDLWSWNSAGGGEGPRHADSSRRNSPLILPAISRRTDALFFSFSSPPVSHICPYYSCLSIYEFASFFFLLAVSSAPLCLCVLKVLCSAVHYKLVAPCSLCVCLCVCVWVCVCVRESLVFILLFYCIHCGLDFSMKIPMGEWVRFLAEKPWLKGFGQPLHIAC